MAWINATPLSPEEHDSFWIRVGLPTVSGCLPWIGHVAKSGYGAYPHRGGQVRAHRVAYIEAYGSIPDGMIIDHLCRNRSCVNPDHLEAVDNWTNVRRGDSPVAVNFHKTHCKRGHEFTPENTYVPPKRPTQRNCRQCKRGDRKVKRVTRPSPWLTEEIEKDRDES
jgi:HNH endonuclease